MLTMAIGLAFGGFASLTLQGVHGVDINWIWFTLAFWLVAWAISVLGVQISTRAQLVLALVSVAVIFAWAIYVLIKGGSSGFSLQPFNPGESSFTGITYGIVYAGLIFVGFESAANLAEETAEPKRNIPRAIFYSVLAAAVFYVVLAWALILAFGLNVGDLLKAFPALYAATSNPDFGGTRFSELVQWLVVIDIAAVGLATATGTTRGIFALARDRHLPSPLAAVHPRFKTPHVAASFVAVCAIVTALVVRISNGLAPGSPTDPPGPLVPVLPVRSHDRSVPALRRLPADRVHGLQGTARGESRRARARRHPRGRDERRRDLWRVLQGAVDLVARQGLVARADLGRDRRRRGAGREVAREPRLARARRARLALGQACAGRPTPSVHAATEPPATRRSAWRSARCAARTRRGRRSGRTRRPYGPGGRPRTEADGGNAGLDRLGGAVVPVVESSEGGGVARGRGPPL